MKNLLFAAVIAFTAPALAQTCPIQDETSNLGGMTWFVAGADPFCVVDLWNTSGPVTDQITVHGSQGPGFGGTFKSSLDMPVGPIDSTGTAAAWTCTGSTTYGCWKWQTSVQVPAGTNQIQIQGHDCGGRACNTKGYGYVYVTVQQTNSASADR